MKSKFSAPSPMQNSISGCNKHFTRLFFKLSLTDTSFCISPSPDIKWGLLMLINVNVEFTILLHLINKQLSTQKTT